MAKPDKTSKSGFVIKLSCETVQKLSEEDQQAKNKIAKELAAESTKNLNVSKSENASVDVTNFPTEDKRAAVRSSSEPSAEANKTEKPSLEKDSEDTGDSDSENNKSVSSDGTSWGDYAAYVSYEGEEAIYTDPSSQQKYTWNKESNSWDPRSSQGDVPGREYSYEDDTHVYTESDGSKFFWDPEKKAWIPKVDDDFLAYYQMSYGFIDNSSKEPDSKDDPKTKDHQKKDQKPDQDTLKRKNEPQWFEPSEDKNTKVYVSNLPQDLTEEEFVNFMQKCGLVERDPRSQKMKVKLYMDKEHSCFKGDALCTYIKIESVDLALKLLDGSDYKGNKIKVERAHFQLKGEYNPALKPKKKKKKELEKLKKMQQKLFDWRPEKFVGERSKHERVVIIKNLFHPSDFDKDVQLILDYQQDLREECSKAGEVRKVVIYDGHPEGVAQVTMKEPEQADAAVLLISGRWFGKRQITAEIWDGRTKYRIAETDADIGKRIDKWGKFLEGKDGEDKDKKSEPIKESSGDNTENATGVKNETEVSPHSPSEDKSDT